MKHTGEYANRQVAWISMAIGAATGMLLGLWSFDGPLGVASALAAVDVLRAQGRRPDRAVAIAVFPVRRSPMISSRCPRPIGIIESIALMPVCSGWVTG